MTRRDLFSDHSGRWADDMSTLRYRMLGAALFLVAVTVIGIVGYRVLAPGTGWVDAFYMTAITLTTVGYGEIVDLSANPVGRVFTAGLILVGMGGVLYFVSTATAFVLEGQLGHVFWRRRMEKIIDSLDGHLIVCGSGQTARYTIDELLAVGRDVVVICETQDRVDWLRRDFPDVPVVVGDPSHDRVLHDAGVERAAGLIACTDDDKENLVVTLSARQMNPGLRIVSRVKDMEAEDKIYKVGASSVVSPTKIGALRLASELIRPTVVSFLDQMLRDRDSNLRVGEVTIAAGTRAVGATIDSLGLGDASDALLLAVREDGSWRYNPPGTFELAAGQVLILLGSPEDIRGVERAVGGSAQPGDSPLIPA